MTRTYRNETGQRLPSAATIIGRFREPSGLIRWAYHRGRNSIALPDAPEVAEPGVIASDMVGAHLHGIEWLPEAPIECETLRTAKSAFTAYCRWERKHKLRIRHIKVPLASAEFRFGGTLDAIGTIAGKLALFDWKASNAVYQNHLVALGAHRALWDENYPDQPLTGGFHVFRFARQSAAFSHHFYPQLDEAWEQFVLFRRAYDIDALLKKRTAATPSRGTKRPAPSATGRKLTAPSPRRNDKLTAEMSA
jgi:hypothetical protein